PPSVVIEDNSLKKTDSIHSTISENEDLASTYRSHEEEENVKSTTNEKIGYTYRFASRMSTESIHDEECNYESEKNNRKLYDNDELHVEMIALLINLLITKNETLDHNYTDQHPTARNMINIPYLLHMHVNHKANESIIPKLHDTISKLGKGATIFLRL